MIELSGDKHNLPEEIDGGSNTINYYGAASEHILGVCLDQIHGRLL
jgi:hypothetical protein